MLHHPSLTAETTLSVDVSVYAVGAELSQRGPDGCWRPIAFLLKGLSAAEKKYLRHVSGKKNVIPEGFSRPPPEISSVLAPTLDFAAMALDQADIDTLRE